MKRLLAKLSARFYITMGLVSLVVSLLLVAFFLGVVPDEDKATRLGRAALAESIAAYSTALISQQQTEQLQTTLGFVVDRNPDLLSAAIRTSDGETLTSWGDHIRHWREAAGKLSSDASIVVPIFSGEQSWGQVELAFKPLRPTGLKGLLYEPQIRLALLLGSSAFVLFYFYLGRMLKNLDPSRAVPERVRDALNTLTEGLLVMDTKGHIVLANQAFADFLGREQNSLTGETAAALAWENDQRAKPAASDYPWQQALKTGAPSRNTLLWLTGTDGKRRTFMTNCSPILVGKGEYGGVMVSLDDVTELEEKEIELRKSQLEAESANQAKSDFLANMSHEIRSPMNAILGFTELLRRGQAKDEAEYRHHLDIVHASGTHLLALINDILDLSKVEAGRLEVEQIACSPYQIAHEVVQAQGVKAAEKGIAITLDCPTAMPQSMETDPARLRQILTNLIGNAIKFTSKGGVRLTLRFLPSRPVAQLQFDVSDSGIGIAADKLESVFEPFVQAEGFITRRFGGTGLGLDHQPPFCPRDGRRHHRDQRPRCRQHLQRYLAGGADRTAQAAYPRGNHPPAVAACFTRQRELETAKSPHPDRGRWRGKPRTGAPDPGRSRRTDRTGGKRPHRHRKGPGPRLRPHPHGPANAGDGRRNRHPPTAQPRHPYPHRGADRPRHEGL